MVRRWFLLWWALVQTCLPVQPAYAQATVGCWSAEWVPDVEEPSVEPVVEEPVVPEEPEA